MRAGARSKARREAAPARPVSTDIDQAADLLQQLGNRTRLEIVRLLVRAGPSGLAVGEVQAHVGVPSSTLSHHLARLREVGLITQRRSGTTLYCTVDYPRLDGLLAFLTDECCQGVMRRDLP